MPTFGDYKPKSKAKGVNLDDPFSTIKPTRAIPLGFKRGEQGRIGEGYKSWGEFIFSLIPLGKFVPVIRHDPNLDFFKIVAGTVGKNGLAKFKEDCFVRAKGVCQICGQPVSIASYYDDWVYDPEILTCTLKKIMICCDICYTVARIDIAQIKGKLDIAARQLAKLNEWELIEGGSYLHYALELKAEWSDLEWKIITPIEAVKKKYS